MSKAFQEQAIANKDLVFGDHDDFPLAHVGLGLGLGLVKSTKQYKKNLF